MVASALHGLTHWDVLGRDALTGRDPITPAGLAYLNINLTAWIGVAVLVTWVVHRVRPGLLISVAGRVRWRWLGVSVGLALVALLATLVVELLVPATTTGPEPHWQTWTSRLTAYALVVAVTTPLQAIGEEFLFRGYLTQWVGGLFAPGTMLSRVLPVVVPATLFALAHGSQGLPVFIDRLCFGLLAGVLVVVTGGLEAGIAMHVLNNLFAFGIAIATGDVTTTLAAKGGTWWLIPITLTQSGLFLLLVLWARRRQGAEFMSADCP